jgi:hypothetical protein
MGTVISNLKARFGVETSDFKKGLKDGESAMSDFKGSAGSIIDEFASMFGVNMSAVNDAIGTANKSLNFLGQSFIAAKKGGDTFAIGMKVIKLALVSTGIGALVVLLGSLIAYFTKSGEGADKFAKILAQIKSVINNVIDRLAIFGKGLWEILSGKFKQGWQDMTGAFKGMGEEIKEDWKQAGALADAEDALEDREIALINSLEERKAKVAELRRQAKEEMDDQRKKLALLAEAEKITKSVYADQISLENERLRIMKEKLAIQTSDPTDEQNRTIAEQEAKINALIRSQADELRAMLKERNAATKALEKELAMVGAFKQIKMPDLWAPYKKGFDALKESMGKLRPDMIRTGEEISALFQALGQVGINAAESLNNAFTSGAEGLGEFLGQLASGKTGISGFGNLIGGVFADLAITVGKVAIGAGMAVLGIKQALMAMNPGVAIAAGIALVALGTMIKSSLKSAASGGGSASVSSSGSGSGSGGLVYDTRASIQPLNINITGSLTAKGPDLVYVFNQESLRKKAVT